MNAGLSNLFTLKSWLLTASMVTGSDFDAQILAIGKGVAGQLETYCNRKFVRTVDDTFDRAADIAHLVLPRYPIEIITKIEIRFTYEEGWVDQGTVSDLVWNIAEKSGLVTFPIRLSWPQARVRFTYTGGYIFEQLEPSDGGYPTTPVVGPTPLPADLLLAWQLQCEHVWTQRDKLGLAIAHDVHAANARVVPALAQIDLLPAVKDLLQQFICFSLT